MSGVYNIPSGYSFLESLVSGLLCIGEQNPLQLSQMEVFLPTRRACLEVERGFLHQGKGKCLLLPKLSPLGDLDEDEEVLSSPQDDLGLRPVIPPFKRLGLLTKLIEDYTKKTGLPSSVPLSLKLAKSLVKIMDQAAIEDVPWEGLAQLVPSEFASHWQLTLDFLEIITTHWPKILEEQGFVEPYGRHHQLIDAIITRWENSPPQHPIIAAGSTGTMPATAKLLQKIVRLPQGMVILPGLDTSLKEEEIKNLSLCHPQYALTYFLKGMNLQPSDVPLWFGLEGQEEKGRMRARLFAEAMRPIFTPLDPRPEEALEGVSMVPCGTPQEEALAIAILLRQQLEVPHQRIALITSDLKLAERVTWELKRWNIEIDSSSGQALAHTPSGIFLKLCAEFAVVPEDQVALLSLLKHPLFCMGKPRGALRTEIRQFEKNVLRGKSFTTPSWLHEFLDIVRPLTEIVEAAFEIILRIHGEVAERLSTDKEIWKGVQGDALLRFMEELKKASPDFPPMTLKDYSFLLEEFFQGQRLRFRPQKHPRLSILGPIEARLFHADVMILGGLNEGSWPPEIAMDPWLNRPMRKEMGFPLLERRVGLSAHDFGQAFSSAKVYLTRALKVDGTPTLACRWLERLEVYLKALGMTLPEELRVLEWRAQLDQPKGEIKMDPPLPSPPVKVRPRRLSVTQIETWMRDPYALYSRFVLGLIPMDPLNVQIEASDRGILLHKALEQFFKICPDPYHRKALDVLLVIGKTLFEPYTNDSSVRLFWWPRFCHLARWFIDYERQTRIPRTQTFTEVKGSFTFSTALGSFECTAKADRIDVLPDGRLRIVDYKVGVPPTDTDVMFGFSPQLPLEGAIALQRGFEGISSGEIESLQYWWIKGDVKGGIVKPLPGDPKDLSLKALAGLERMVALFENETTPYPARPYPAKALKYNDYAHFERLQEWGRF